MRIIKQPDGTALNDDELRQLTALLVKLGYAVKISREKVETGKSVTQKVIKVWETEDKK